MWPYFGHKSQLNIPYLPSLLHSNSFIIILFLLETTCISQNKFNVGPDARPVVELFKSEEKDLGIINKVDIHSRASQRKRPKSATFTQGEKKKQTPAS